jgi:pantoate--beta-alanine ligase
MEAKRKSMAEGLQTVRTVAELRGRITGWRRQDLRVGLVPTMGALHEGHLSLVRHALERTDRAVVTLFVNPKQFGPKEDFGRYPRDEERDARLLAGAGAHLLFAPAVAEMYPAGFLTQVSVPQLGDVLEGAFRPGFFTGVSTVVAKLLLQALPDAAVFGEKDFQQLQVIRRMTADLDIPVEIVGAPTVREADGLAMSSRNAYLSPQERTVAPALHQVIRELARRHAAGDDPAAGESWAAATLLSNGFRAVDYVTVRDAASFGTPVAGAPARVLAAAWLGTTRLIDNIAAG